MMQHSRFVLQDALRSYTGFCLEINSKQEQKKGERSNDKTCAKEDNKFEKRKERRVSEPGSGDAGLGRTGTTGQVLLSHTSHTLTS